jgi:hypothetical protein
VALRLVVLCPVILWLCATLVQATTQKVRVETIRLGLRLQLLRVRLCRRRTRGDLAVPLLPKRDVLRRARPLLIALAVTFVVAQGVINDSVHREFGERLEANRVVLAAYSDEPAEDVRCARDRVVAELPYWQPYYREALVEGMNAGYRHFHHEPFCSTAAADSG